MSYTGEIRNGVVVFDAGTALPDGTRVKVEPLQGSETQTRPVGEVLLEWAGKGVGLPEDLAQNHDHYLHGLPKR